MLREAILSTALVAISVPAAAQNSTSFDDAKRLLLEKYDEHPLGFGLSNTGTVVNLFISKDHTTWSLLRVDPTGATSIIDTGSTWVEQSMPLKGIDG